MRDRTRGWVIVGSLFGISIIGWALVIGLVLLVISCV